MIMKLAQKTVPGHKRHNKGFSLIELIIVITIMAILTALLAPQLLRYVEQARQAKDRAVIDEVHRAFQLSFTAPDVAASGNLWYTPEGTIPNINKDFAQELALVLGGTAKDNPSASHWIITGLPPLTSKLYTTTSNASDTRAPIGGQIFRFTQKNGEIIVVYLNDPLK